MASRYITAKQAADRLGVSVKTVIAYVRDGKLKGIRPGKLYLIDSSLFDAKRKKRRRPVETPKPSYSFLA